MLSAYILLITFYVLWHLNSLFTWWLAFISNFLHILLDNNFYWLFLQGYIHHISRNCRYDFLFCFGGLLSCFFTSFDLLFVDLWQDYFCWELLFLKVDNSLLFYLFDFLWLLCLYYSILYFERFRFLLFFIIYGLIFLYRGVLNRLCDSLSKSILLHES